MNTLVRILKWQIRHAASMCTATLLLGSCTESAYEVNNVILKCANGGFVSGQVYTNQCLDIEVLVPRNYRSTPDDVKDQLKTIGRRVAGARTRISECAGTMLFLSNESHNSFYQLYLQCDYLGDAGTESQRFIADFKASFAVPFDSVGISVSYDEYILYLNDEDIPVLEATLKDDLQNQLALYVVFLIRREGYFVTIEYSEMTDSESSVLSQIIAHISQHGTRP